MSKPTLAELQSKIDNLATTNTYYRTQNEKLVAEKAALTTEVTSLKVQLQWVKQLCQSLSETLLQREKNR
jgi:cell division protein FtsB